MSTNNKRDMEVFEDDDEYDEDYKDGSSLHDALLRKIGILCQKCFENKRIITKLKMELILSKSHVRQTKCQKGLINIGMARRLIFLTWFLAG
jgi:hypothetical protein